MHHAWAYLLLALLWPVATLADDDPEEWMGYIVARDAQVVMFVRRAGTVCSVATFGCP